MQLRLGGNKNNIGPVLTGLLSALFYQLGFVLFLFLVPLQVLFERKGEQPFFVASISAWAAIALIRMFELRRMEALAGLGALAAIDIAVPAVFLFGLWVMNSRHPQLPSTIYRLLIAGLVSIVVLVPGAVALLSHEGARSLMTDQFRMVYNSIVSAGGGVAVITFDEFLVMSGSLLASSFAFMYLVVLSSNWLLGKVIGSSAERALALRALGGFQVPLQLTWPALISWAGMLFSLVLPLGPFRFVFWNAGLTALLLYGVQGIAIIRHEFERRNLSRGARTLFVGAMVLGLMIPGLNILVLIGVPLLGISELWINYYRFEGVEQP
ncbi:MAG: hypothetical protein EA428_14075 [Spirochaetaceae bacterium]|nr:MAG: hypothetical protein EA428_14075 [Spirochaetaceae bacterium]